MTEYITICLLMVATGPGPEINAAQFSEIIKKEFEPFGTLVFLYDGQTRWVGPATLGVTSESFDDEFHGTYLYREDGAGLMDVLMIRKNPPADVLRKKRSVLNGQSELIRGLREANAPIDPARDIQTGPGSTSSLSDISGTQNLFWSAWYWRERGDLNTRNYTFQGWEAIDGRDCLRFQIDTYQNSERHDLDFRRFWIDVKRNAHVVKFEEYKEGNLIRTVGVTLMELQSPDGKRIWFPAKSVVKTYVWENVYYAQPITEQPISVVPDSIQAEENAIVILFILGVVDQHHSFDAVLRVTLGS
jgi:hypothetical protein